MSKKPRTGRTPDILRKGGPIKDRSQYDRKKTQEDSLDDWDDRPEGTPSDGLTDEDRQARR